MKGVPEPEQPLINRKGSGPLNGSDMNSRSLRRASCRR